MKLIKRVPDKGYLDTWLWVPKSFVNVEGTKNALSFTFYDSYAANNVRYLYLYKEEEHHLLVPRAFWNPETLPFDVVDCRPRYFPQVKLGSKIKLDHRSTNQGLVSTGEDVQQKSVDAMKAAEGGVLQLACGKGKTVVALEVIAQLRVPAIIIVDNTHLLEQWKRDIDNFLELDEPIGIIQAEKFDWKRPVVLATYQTIAAKADTMPEEARRWFGVVIWDEAHHVAAPTFAKSADLFYGRRYGLTATPTRADGLHIIYDLHIGDIVYKDLDQALKPSLYFKWTGMHIDETDPQTRVRDKNGELHLSKLTSYFGRWRKRLEMVIDDVRIAATHGRKILVLSNSIDEVINLWALWTYGPGTSLYSDIPIPTPQDVGETLSPINLAPTDRKKKLRNLEDIKKRLQSQTLHPNKRQQLSQRKAQLEQLLKQCKVQSKIEAELRKRQKPFLNDLLESDSTAGIMIHGVPPKVRAGFLTSRQVVFAITKYGREGLDCAELDTVVVSTPFSGRNSLQQVMGRTVRANDNKKRPVVLFYEDEVGPLIGMCRKLRRHLRNWPHEEGGPYDCELIGHPQKAGTKWEKTISQVFGPSLPQQGASS
jgi:superfamily II DNA or RNA helicase